MSLAPYNIKTPTTGEVPIIVSVPHCGTTFPPELRDEFDPYLLKSIDDTDWFVDQLYDFVPSLGITMISAAYSRWIIDLNRDPNNKPLYTDGRIITGLCPTSNFLGESLYRDRRPEVDALEVQNRLEQYYWPYHEKLQLLIEKQKSTFNKVLLWDCHSIRQQVKTIYTGKFPDLILGDNDGRSASAKLIEIAYSSLQSNSYSVSHNHPFKGGYITRHYGNPDQHQHALQLEMSKVNYMADDEMNYSEQQAKKIRLLLKTTFEKLIEELSVT